MEEVQRRPTVLLGITGSVATVKVRFGSIEKSVGS